VCWQQEQPVKCMHRRSSSRPFCFRGNCYSRLQLPTGPSFAWCAHHLSSLNIWSVLPGKLRALILC
jgi:hypothetical protein